jgi:hypothetical protein
MYLRTTRRRNADGSVVQYYQLAENVWDRGKGCAVAKVVYNFGRADELDRPALQRLARSILRVFSGEEALAAEPDVRVHDAWPYGVMHAVEALWQELEIDTVLGDRGASPRRRSASQAPRPGATQAAPRRDRPERLVTRGDPPVAQQVRATQGKCVPQRAEAMSKSGISETGRGASGDSGKCAGPRAPRSTPAASSSRSSISGTRPAPCTAMSAALPTIGERAHDHRVAGAVHAVDLGRRLDADTELLRSRHQHVDEVRVRGVDARGAGSSPRHRPAPPRGRTRRRSSHLPRRRCAPGARRVRETARSS